MATGGSYALAALEASGATSPQVLRLAKPDTAETYYVSLRQPIGVDTALAATYQNTLSIHRSTGTLPAKTFLLANVAAGQSWTDSINGIQIRNDGASRHGRHRRRLLQRRHLRRARRRASQCTPASQIGSRGATLGYTLTVTNNNSAACPSSTFNLTQALPAGFGGGLGAPNVILASGASASRRLERRLAGRAPTRLTR